MCYKKLLTFLSFNKLMYLKNAKLIMFILHKYGFENCANKNLYLKGAIARNITETCKNLN